MQAVAVAAIESARGFVLSKLARLLLLPLMVGIRSAQAKTQVEVLTNVISQTGGSGKQVYDNSGNENMTLIEPEVFIESVISPETTVTGRAVMDSWTSASVKAFDTNTGVSTRGTKSESRTAAYFSLTQKFEPITITPSLGYSSETAYDSLSAGLSLSKGFAENCFTVSVDYLHFEDSVQNWDLNTDKLTGKMPKRTDTVSVGASQILTPSDIVYVGVEESAQAGFLSTSRNTVNVNGTRVYEVVPSSRFRSAYYARGVHGFNDILAAHLDYRFYNDNWSISAHSIEPSLAASLGEEHEGLIRVFYRFHTQTATEYYQPQFSAPAPYMTSDSDLSAFSANEVGLQGSWRFDRTGAISFISVGGGFVYYVRSNDLAIAAAQVNLTAGF